MSDPNFNYSGFSSAAIHSGKQKESNQAHITPIYASSTYVFDSVEQGIRRFSGKEEGYIYSRWGNPTIAEAEEKVSALESFGIKDENGSDLRLKTILHASGMSAISTLLIANVKAGEKILSHPSLYGGVHELVEKVLPSQGIETVFADLTDLEVAEAAMTTDRSVKLLYLETPANPTIQCVDIEALTTIAKRNDILVAVDNTFATPYLQQPFKYGVDFVVHSTTKFLNGHGTAIGGALVGKDIELMRTDITKVHRLLGGNSNPFDAFLLSQGIKTLEIRMQRHCDNAMKVAEHLDTHPAISKVNYLGLQSHANFATGKKQMRHPGAMLSFEMKDGLQAATRFINRLQMCVNAVSLGTCDTLLSHPAGMTHYGVAKEVRESYGITDGLIRMSVGIENIDDIINDLEQALSN